MADVANHAMIEPRVSLDVAARWFDRAGFSLIVGTIIVLVSTVAIVWLGIIKEHHWDLARDEAKLKIAGLEADTAKARAELGNANAEIAKAQAAAAEAHARAAEANEKAERERLERLNLEQQVKPRSLTSAQAETLLQHLKAGPKGRVIVKPNFMDMEATAFANQIIAVFHEAGYASVADAPLEVISTQRAGITVAIKNSAAPPAHTEPILAGLQAAGIPRTGGNADWVPDESTVVLMVGQKQ